MVIADPAALNVTIPTLCLPQPGSASAQASADTGRPGPGGQGGGGETAAERRKERLDKIKELFRQAVAYDTVVKRARDRRRGTPCARSPTRGTRSLRPRRKARAPARRAAGRDPGRNRTRARAQAQGGDPGGREAWKVADAIKKAEGARPGRRHAQPAAAMTYDPYDSAYTNPAKLHAAGVTIAIHSQSGNSGGGETAVRNLPYEAATAVAFGLPEDVALKAVTHHARANPWSRRPGRLARNRQAGQPGRHRGSPPPADDARAGPLHRRRACPARKPSHPALRQIPPPAGRGSGRVRTARN